MQISYESHVKIGDLMKKLCSMEVEVLFRSTKLLFFKKVSEIPNFFKISPDQPRNPPTRPEPIFLLRPPPATSGDDTGGVGFASTSSSDPRWLLPSNHTLKGESELAIFLKSDPISGGNSNHGEARDRWGSVPLLSIN
jgi:hypothetical protein